MINYFLITLKFILNQIFVITSEFYKKNERFKYFKVIKIIDKNIKIIKMGLLDKYQQDPKGKVTISFTLDYQVFEDLKDLRAEKKLPKISPLINDLIKDWLQKLKQEEQKK